MLLFEMTSDGTRVVLLFEDAAAEAFRILEGLGPEWEILKKDRQGASDLLVSCAVGGVRYVALNPPSALIRGNEESTLVPIGGFIEHLLSERAPQAASLA